MDPVHRDVTASGVRLRVVEVGSGAPVLLLHGLFMDNKSWDGVLGILRSDFRVIAPDLPGFGDSEKPPASRYPYGIEAFAEAVCDLYGGLGMGRAAVVGHGLGGAVALTLSARHPELVSHLVLVDALCYATELDLPRRIALTPFVGSFVFKQLWGRSTFRAMYRDTLVSTHAKVDNARIDGYYETFNTPAARGSALATLRATVDTRSVVADTARVNARTLVVWGRTDKLYPAALGQRLARQIRGAGFKLLDTGHAPQEEAPVELAHTIRDFLRAP
jgi:pimeloyl-ACP methyl ester carboxylesterase